MIIAIWVLSIALALFVGAAGFMKAFRPIEEVRKMPWTSKFSNLAIRGIGVAELLGAVGLIAPFASGILPWLSIVAAVCISALMVGAAVTHVRINDPKSASATCLVLGSLALVVAVLHVSA